MQLFITEFEVKAKQIIIDNIRIRNQLRKVLRANKGYIFQLQRKQANKILRYTVSLEKFTDYIIANIENIEEKNIKESDTGVIIAMLNKFDKMEFIVQKLSEIGIKNIIFTPTSRSIIRVFKEKKMERIKKISLEAVEQSKWWYLPNIIFEKNFSNVLEDKRIYILNMDGEKVERIDIKKEEYLFIWPEWGITKEDIALIWDKLIKTINIWDTILRAETAAIIGGWLIR